MTEEDFEIPNMFIERAWIGGEENMSHGTTYVKLMEWPDEILLGEFGLTSEAGYIERNGDEWVFEAASREDSEIDKPPFRRVFRVEKEGLKEELLEQEQFFYGEAVREAWENWSEGDEFRLKIDGDEREFEADDSRLMEYERGH